MHKTTKKFMKVVLCTYSIYRQPIIIVLYDEFQILNGAAAKHFVILFRDHGQQYRALYSYDPDEEIVYKIQGTGPKQIVNKLIERFYK